MQFKGTKNYIATDDLSMAVNASVALERPLLIKGEPGTGKTLLAKYKTHTSYCFVFIHYTVFVFWLNPQ